MQIFAPVDDNFWVEVAKSCAEATFFHTPFWQRLAVGTYPNYRDRSLGVEWKSGVRGVIPLLETGRTAKGLLRNFTSTFAGCYGGLITDGPITPAERQAVYQALLEQHRFGRLQIVGNPLQAEEEGLASGQLRPDFTQLLPLKAGYDRLLANFSKGHKSSLKKGRRLGVTTRLAETLEDYRTYYRVYEALLTAWGAQATSRYPWRLFEGAYGLAQEAPEQIKLWLADRGGQVIGGVLVFYWNRHAAGWHAATEPEAAAFCPGNVLYAAIIEDACDQGYDYYDFNPSGGHAGVVSFKKSFGAEKRTINRYIFSGRLDQWARRAVAKVVALKRLRR